MKSYVQLYESFEYSSEQMRINFIYEKESVQTILLKL